MKCSGNSRWCFHYRTVSSLLYDCDRSVSPCSAAISSPYVKGADFRQPQSVKRTRQLLAVQEREVGFLGRQGRLRRSDDRLEGAIGIALIQLFDKNAIATHLSSDGGYDMLDDQRLAFDFLLNVVLQQGIGDDLHVLSRNGDAAGLARRILTVDGNERLVRVREVAMSGHVAKDESFAQIQIDAVGGDLPR